MANATTIGTASYSPSEYSVVKSLKSQLEAKEKLVGQQAQELDRVQRSMDSTHIQIAELKSAIAVLESAARNGQT